MKSTINLILLCFLLIVAMACTKSVGPESDDDVPDENGLEMAPADDSALSDSMQDAYYVDAARLALDYLLNNEEGPYSVALDESRINDYYNGLVHVYNATDIPARDSVILMYDIRVFSIRDVRYVSLTVDSSAEWVQAWREGNLQTGNVAVDSLVEAYHLEVDNYYEGSFYHSVLLYTPTPLNTVALSERFESVEGIIYANPSGWIGDGNDISLEPVKEGLVLTYSVGYGDCPAGCIARHYWEFLVEWDGNVTYQRSYGDPAP